MTAVVMTAKQSSLVGTIEPQLVLSSEKNVIDQKIDGSSKLSASSMYTSFLAGTTSGVCAAVIFQPLDVLKTRVQSSINKGHGAEGLTKTFVNIVRHERVFALWNGVIPSVVRCVPGMGIYFSTIHMLKTKLGRESGANTIESLCMGAAARTVAVSVMLPFTVIKTRFECGEFFYKNMRVGLKTIYLTEGFKGLYSGLTATVLRDAPFSALYYTFYTRFKVIAKKEFEKESLSPQVHFLCGLSAGLLASVATQPADVIKTHMQMYPHRYSLIRHAVLRIIRDDGSLGFFRGLSARMIRRTLVAASAWTVYEKIMQLAGLKT